MDYLITTEQLQALVRMGFKLFRVKEAEPLADILSDIVKRGPVASPELPPECQDCPYTDICTHPGNPDADAAVGYDFTDDTEKRKRLEDWVVRKILGDLSS